jgi:hypothetical protein
MTLPLEPDVTQVHDDDAEPPFVPAPELEAIARHVLVRFEELASLYAEVYRDDASIDITYVFETKDFDPTEEELEPHTIAKVTKASPLWQAVAQTHLVIQFRRWFYDRFTEDQRSAVLYHELSHVDVRAPGKVRIRKHEIEEFVGVYRHFGAILPGRRGVLDAFAEFEKTNRPRTH